LPAATITWLAVRLFGPVPPELLVEPPEELLLVPPEELLVPPEELLVPPDDELLVPPELLELLLAPGGGLPTPANR
jgi:hypothetical protein